MRKVLVGILLLALIVGLSYVKALRSRKQMDVAVDASKQSLALEIASYRLKIDSLKQAMGQKEVQSADALVSKDISYQSLIDSLGRIVDSLNQHSQGLSKELAARKSSPSKKKPETAAKKSKVSERHREILAYYKKRFEQLPKDLSKYETRVARSEIREETAQKFAISSRELDNIRNQNGLKY
ncbi:MAG: hypothetical protein ACE5FH_01710 [Candidatus Zixiibacteriota bacterium]